MYLLWIFSIAICRFFCVVYLQANRGFQKIISQARKKISCSFLHLVHLHEIFQNKLVLFLDPPDPLPLCGLKSLKRSVARARSLLVIWTWWHLNSGLLLSLNLTDILRTTQPKKFLLYQLESPRLFLKNFTSPSIPKKLS